MENFFNNTEESTIKMELREIGLPVDVFSFGLVMFLILNETQDINKEFSKTDIISSIKKGLELSFPELKIKQNNKNEIQKQVNQENIEELEKLMNECVNWNQIKRPNFQQIHQIITRTFVSLQLFKDSPDILASIQKEMSYLFN